MTTAVAPAPAPTAASSSASSHVSVSVATSVLDPPVHALVATVTSVATASSSSSSSSSPTHMSRDALLSFVFPSRMQHPISRGRLWMLAEYGPLVPYHTYVTCLCTTCQAHCRSNRKTDDVARQLYSGALFTSNASFIPSSSTSPTSTSSSATTSDSLPSPLAANATSARPPASPMTRSTGTLDASAGATTATSSTSSTAPTAVTTTTPATATTTTAPPRPNPLDLLALLPTPPSASPFRSPSAAARTILPTPTFLCPRCATHAHHDWHVAGGKHARFILSSHTIDALARRLEEEDLLEAYHRRNQLSECEEREFLVSIDPTRVARAHRPFSKAELLDILRTIPTVAQQQQQQQQRQQKRPSSGPAASTATSASAFASSTVTLTLPPIRRTSNAAADGTSPTSASTASATSSSSSSANTIASSLATASSPGDSAASDSSADTATAMAATATALAATLPLSSTTSTTDATHAHTLSRTRSLVSPHADSADEVWEFEAIRRAVLALRAAEVDKLRRMYPSLTEKGKELKEMQQLKKVIVVPYAGSVLTDHLLHAGSHTARAHDRAVPQRPAIAAMHARQRARQHGGGGGVVVEAKEESVDKQQQRVRPPSRPVTRGVRKIPDHLSFTVTERLMHRYAHVMTELDEHNDSDLPHNVKVVRSSALASDQSMGWRKV